jgi:hypothetical protein
MSYERHGFGNWHKGNGSKFFFEDLAWAVAHCGGIVRVIVAIRDGSVFPLVRTMECYPSKKLMMRVKHLDPVAGAFRLEQVARTDDVRSVDFGPRPVEFEKAGIVGG